MSSPERDAAVAVLCDPSLAHVVDLVAHPDGDAVVVANAAGSSRLTAAGTEVLAGRDPVANQDPLALSSLEDELGDPSPPNERNAYPHAYTRLSSLFADRRAPDIAVVHTGKHHWPDRGGHLGEHGSLSVVQSRAPLLLSGAGVDQRGVLSRAARVVDVGPTLAALSGATTDALAGLDGQPLADVAVPGAARRVVGLLWDGTNANSLRARAESGELPAVARLLSRGCLLAGGAVAEFPSNTLVNHTSALTGLGPGRHGIVSNEFYDCDTGAPVVANSMTEWHRAMELLRPGVHTVFELCGGDSTACVNDPVDVGAAYSTFALIRASGGDGGAADLRSALPPVADDANTTREYAESNAAYEFGSQVDAVGLTQVLSLFETAGSAPRLTWWNTMLTDTGHHEGGPHSDLAHAAMTDADRRLGVFLDHLDSIGAYDDTVFLLTADHGSEGADPAVTGDWDEALRDAGVDFRDEAYGFIYLGV